MRKIMTTFLVLIIMLNLSFTYAVAYSPDYSSYEGSWIANPDVSIYDDHRGITITRSDNNSMDFDFFWYQFGVQIKNAKISGTNIYGHYYEVWDDGVDWNNYIMQGDITLVLGQNDITIYWTGVENGDSFSKEFKVYNPNFTYKEINNIKVNLNGTELYFDQSPIIENDRVMVPIRAIFEALGYIVEWHGDTQTAVAYKGNNTITVQINNPEISYNRGTYLCDVSPKIVSGRTLVPVRAISECAGCNVDWNGQIKTVFITSN